MEAGRVARFREQFTFIPGNGIEVGDTIVISDQTEWLPRATSNFGSTNTDHYRYLTSPTSSRTTAQNFCWNSLPGTYIVNGQTWQVFAPTEDVQYDAIEVVVYRLRKKLQGTGVVLVTLRGLGYLLELEASA